jgi:hypothetical protein
MREAPGRYTAIAAVGLLLASAMTTSTSASSSRSVVSAPSVRLDVLLTVSSQLTDLARRALIGEAERIWAHERVDVEWPAPAGGAERPDAPLRVLVIARPKATVIDTRRWPVAELIRHAEDRALAIASIDGARRVVDEATRYSVLASPGMEEHRLGLVLGRAVAHEIGHFLLATGTHAQHGLMRASVGALDFASVDRDTFRLDDGASRWIRERLTEREPVVRTLQAAGFSYGPQD